MASRAFKYFLSAAVIAALSACSSDSSSSVEVSEQLNPEISESSSSIATGDSSSETGTTSSSSRNEVLDESSSSEVVDSGTSTEKTSSSSADQIASSSSDISTPEASSSSETVASSSNISPYLWNDEFDGDAIDTEKWTFEIGTGASGWGNNEWQYYTDRSENAYIKDGILHIRANKESFEGASYTSARMITKGKFSFTYGTIEARIALPVGKGIWPAFWMLGENIDQVSWPACGEIDIIEAVNDENIVYGTNHWQTEGHQADYGNNTGGFHGASTSLDITEFHTYKFTWDEKLIAMYVDDFKYHEISIEDNAGGTEAFHKPFFLLLNVAVAGNWPGFEVDDAQFPNEMLIDYIRVTQN
ncbi:MAG: glycoside hydrolase family 16 protein [Fibrobacter sp.]|nr:glycoside hydrolase family 16 protein [Fibrobacter sp.]